jgi:hypothetical protein
MNVDPPSSKARHLQLKSQIRSWCNRGLLKFYANPDPLAGRL